MAAAESCIMPGPPNLGEAIATRGFAVFDAAHPHADVARLVSSPAWPAFAASWNGMPRDQYMADGGRYRRRRYGVFAVDIASIRPAPHQPHYQTLAFNHLNGGIERWFEPIAPEIAGGPVLTGLLRLCHDAFAPLTPAVKSWHAEVHQFRIESEAGAAGNPTPEGMHRDGVDYVLVAMIDRVNIASGTTLLADADKRPIGSFTLVSPGDSVFLDDHRVYHGVTPVTAVDPLKPAYRDVLVITFTDAAKSRQRAM
jgi:hypothetical protein